RQAGARPVHALGRARLGQLRPGNDVGCEGRDRRERQHRRVRCHELRPGVVYGHACRVDDRVRHGARPADRRRPRAGRPDVLGIALGGFANSQAGNVADIEVNIKTGKIVVKHAYAAQVAGLSVAPALLENQISGSLIMSTSRALYEEVTFNKGRVTSLDWVSYP